ncbi:TonB-dependent receptor [Psychroflexus sp. MES1-P1E]|uniref:TonB-dependent receptor n=1 Tax=Psychroflexus sp. MES1-P1E TaxID=2058320 RepID=UPI000C7A198E|nr:carboxypeptidase-like regulatory domain-containing protein [Psychroflexus sp. MES1-P1E]PKG43111.1 hypothetical protein CXF67_06940 [Psychroflexus sp. MES1-P1E]
MKICFNLLVCFVLFPFNNSYTQNSLKGTVKDSLNRPLVNVTILAEPKDSLQQIKFAITDDKGRYRLNLKSILYTVTANYLGYAKQSFEIKLNEDQVKDIVLKQSAENLKEVILDMPMVVKKDTITYNVNQLTTGEERKLKDILKKLPGVEVDRNGGITVNGKKITHMLVENKKFFGGGTKLAVDNIPADAVKQVEVLDNYNEIAMLKDFQESEDMAMNIKLEDDKKDFVFGDVEAGVGNDEFYNTQSNLFYYSPKTTLNVIGNLNNVRNRVFTYDQFFSFQEGMNSIFDKGSTSFGDSYDDFSDFLEKEDVIESDRKFGAINFTQEVNNKLNITGYGIFSKTKESTLVESTNEYNTFTEDRSIATATNNQLAMGSFNAIFTPNYKDQWHLRSQFKSADDQYSNSISSEVDTVSNLFLNNRFGDQTFFNQTVEWHRKESRTHSFSGVIDYTYDKLTPRTLWQTNDDILAGLIPIVDEPSISINQFKQTEKNQIKSIFKHYWVLNRNNHIYSTIGNVNLNQTFFTDDAQELYDAAQNNFGEAGFNNDFNFRLNDAFAGIFYKFRTGIFTFDQGAFVHHYRWNPDQENTSVRDKFVLLPNLTAKVEITRSETLQLNYELKSSFSDASQFANRFYLQSYNSVFSGNTTLENTLRHDLNLRFTKSKGYRGFGIYATANYSKQVEGIVDNVNYEGINLVVTPFLVDNSSETWGLSGRVSKKVSQINLQTGLRYTNTTYLQFVNDLEVENQNSNTSYNFSAKTLYDDWPIIEVGWRQNFGNFSLGNNTTNFVTTEAFINFDYDFLDGFIASADFTSYTYRNETLDQSNSYEIANASLLYQKKSSAWSFKIEAQNVFDVQFKNQNSFTSYIISDLRTFILPRIVLFSIGYNL